MEINEAITIINEFYRRNGYSRTRRFTIRRIGKELLAHFNQTERKYSKSEVYKWFALKEKQYKSQYSILIRYSKYLHLIIELEETGLIEKGKIYPYKRSASKPTAPIWKHILNEYLRELTLESKAKSTIAFSRRACTKFILYLETHNCLNPESLDKDFCHRFEEDSTDHNTLNGKRAYQYRIRLFIRYLQRRNLVPKTMEYAVKTHYRIPHKNVTILNDVQKAEVRSARKSDSSYKNRAYAMATLAMYLGLRSIDIVNLKFTDIDWFENSVKVIQQKTKNGLILPLIPSVGNAIADYVLNHRPISDSPCVFVSFHAPYGSLCTKSVCYDSSRRLINKRPPGQPSGMHIMRRTLASDLLRHHVNHNLVSSFLGHSKVESIDPYLNIDCERMVECSLTLGAIGFPEVFR